MDAAVIHRRRWLILAVLSVSVFLVVVDNTIVNVALPTLNRELGASVSELQWIVDAYSLVFAGLLLAAGGLGDRLGPQGGHAGRPRDLRGHLRARRLRHELGPAHRRPRRHGHRGRTDLPGHPGHPHQRLHRADRAGEGHRRLGRGVGSRRGVRTHHRRLPARALLVGIGLPGQRADRHRRPGGRRPAGAHLPRSRGRPLRRARHAPVDQRRGPARAHRHRGPPLGLDLHRHPRRVRRGRPAWHRLRHLGAPGRHAAARRPGLPVGQVQCRGAVPSRWPSSPCSASSSWPPSTSSS